MTAYLLTWKPKRLRSGFSPTLKVNWKLRESSVKWHRDEAKVDQRWGP